MNRQEIISIFRQAIALPPSFEINEGMTPPQVPGWDSLGWLNIITALEDAFSIQFNFEHLEKVYNVGELCDMVETLHAA